MTPERWERVKHLFELAAELPAAGRDAFLLAQAPDDDALRAEVQRLLALNDSTDAIVDRLQPDPGEIRAAIERNAFRPGQVVASRFRVVRLIGEGGMGEVYEAEDLELSERIAIKTTRAELGFDSKLIERFKQEIQSARRVTHPNVCRIYDLFQDECAFLTMELVKGDSLSERIARQGPLATAEALPLLKQMAAALDAAHQAGIVHRDFKSANVLVEPEGRAVVTDFGLARAFSRPETSATLTEAIGTPAYMAPEQVEGQPAGPAADIYALGVVAYELVTGRRPFESASPLALAVRKVRDDPEPPSSKAAAIPPAWDAAILKCLARGPLDRFATAGDFVRALEGQQPVPQPRPSSRATPTWTWKALTGGLAATLATFVVVRTIPVSHKPAPQAAVFFQKGVDALGEDAPHRASRLLEEAVKADPAFPMARARLAQAYMELDMLDRARDEVIRVDALVPDRSRLPKSEALLLAGIQKLVLRDFDAAADTLGQLAAVQPSALFDLGRAQARSGKPEAAVATFRRIVERTPGNAAAWLQLGACLNATGQSSQALEALDHADRAFALEQNYEAQMASAMERSRLFEFRKQLAESKAEVERILALAESTGNRYQAIRARYRLGHLDTLMGRFAEARKHIDAGVAAARDDGFAGLVPAGLNALGFSYTEERKLTDAESTYRSAIEAAERSGNRLEMATAELGAGRALIRRSRAREALPLVARAAAHARQGNYRDSMLAAMQAQVDAEIDLGDHASAWSHAKELFDAAQKSGNDNTIKLARQRLGHMFIVRGDYPAAIAYHQSQREFFQRAGRKSQYLRSLVREARLHSIMGDAASAGRLLDEAEALAGAMGSDAAAASREILSERAFVALVSGRYVEGLRLLERSGLQKAPLKARLLAGAGRMPQALALLQAHAADSESPVVRSHTTCMAAATLFTVGRAAEAASLASRGLEVARTSGHMSDAALCALLSGGSAQVIEEFTRTWPEERRQSFRARADLRDFWKTLERNRRK